MLWEHEPQASAAPQLFRSERNYRLRQLKKRASRRMAAALTVNLSYCLSLETLTLKGKERYL